jgi:hypothetical protein
MENQDLGSKKMNNKQISTDLIPIDDEKHAALTLKSEMEVDKNGEKKVVERARNTNQNGEIVVTIVDKRLSTKPSMASEQLGKKMVENQDLNSDIAVHRYPNSSPENHK